MSSKMKNRELKFQARQQAISKFSQGLFYLRKKEKEAAVEELVKKVVK